MGKKSAATIWYELGWCADHCRLFLCDEGEANWRSEHVLGCAIARAKQHKGLAKKRGDMILEPLGPGQVERHRATAERLRGQG